MDKENLPDRHVSEKLIGFLYAYPQFGDFALHSGYALMPNTYGKLDYATTNAMHKNHVTDDREQLRIMHADGKALSVMRYHIIESLSELFYYEFMQIMQSGRQIKRCKNCGKYFVLKNKRNREHCDRIFKAGKTCREIGAMAQYRESLEDPYLKKAQGLYNTMYARMSRALDKLPGQKSKKDLTKEAFAAWRSVYSQAKKNYIEGSISGDALLEKIRLEN